MEQASLVKLYREVFPDAARLVRRMGGNPDEAKDAFHDALLIYLEKQSKGCRYILLNKAYLLGTTKRLWLHSKQQYFDAMPDDLETFIEEENDAAPEPKTGFQYMLLAGQNCLNILKGVLL